MAYTVWPRIHSLYGRFLGVTPEGYVTGEVGTMRRVNTYTSASTGTKVPSNGVSVFTLTTSSSNSTVFSIDYPRPGVSVTLINVTTALSTQAFTIASTGSYIYTGGIGVPGSSIGVDAIAVQGSSYNAVVLAQHGNTVTLEGVTTAYWVIDNVTGFSTAAAACVSTY